VNKPRTKEQCISDFRKRIGAPNERGCKEWTGHTIRTGHGQVRFMGRLELSHRISYRLSVGEIPDGLCVCHECDNPPCCNPEHLFLGTQLDNMRDCARKGRARGGVKGKVDWATVVELRAAHRIGDGKSKKLVAEKHGLSVTSLYSILSGKTWKRGPR
jgi:hypothetical protein